LPGKTGALEEWVRNAKRQRNHLFYISRKDWFFMNKMMKEEIEEEKIDIETPFLPGELNEK
jgi:hypothetical protein